MSELSHEMERREIQLTNRSQPQRSSKRKEQPPPSQWEDATLANEPDDRDKQQRQRNDRVDHRLLSDRRLGVPQGGDVGCERHGHGDDADGGYGLAVQGYAYTCEKGESRDEGDDHDDAERAVGVAAGDLGWVVHLGMEVLIEIVVSVGSIGAGIKLDD